MESVRKGNMTNSMPSNKGYKWNNVIQWIIIFLFTNVKCQRWCNHCVACGLEDTHMSSSFNIGKQQGCNDPMCPQGTGQHELQTFEAFF